MSANAYLREIIDEGNGFFYKDMGLGSQCKK